MSREQSHITICELVKKLAVPPEKRTNYDCKLMADALYVFISSIDPFKEGLCVVCCQVRNSHRVDKLSLYTEFKQADALAVAKRAELRTVDANQTVFRQGLFTRSLLLSHQRMSYSFHSVRKYYCYRAR